MLPVLRLCCSQSAVQSSVAEQRAALPESHSDLPRQPNRLVLPTRLPRCCHSRPACSARAWASWRTKQSTGLECKFLGKKGAFNLSRIDSFGVELNYLDLGHDRSNLGPVAASADATAFAGYFVGYMQLPLLDLYGKIGAARWDSRANLLGGGTSFSLKDSGTDLAYGAGLQAHFGSLAGRLEYERFKLGSSDGANLVSLGLTWTFL